MSEKTEAGAVTEQDKNIETAGEAPTASAETPATATAIEETPAPVVPDVVWGTGRRKSSVARVRVKPGTGRIICNDREYKDYFPSLQYQKAVEAPLRVTDLLGRYDVLARANGGGLTGQAGALSLGIARALRKMDHSLEDTLRDHGLLTRDARMKERKKYGLHGARRGVQFSKR
jgi:small subunit ribosomal protein S9